MTGIAALLAVIGFLFAYSRAINRGQEKDSIRTVRGAGYALGERGFR